MSNVTRSSDNPTAPGPLLRLLLQNAVGLRLGLFVLAGLLAAMPIYLLIRQGSAAVTHPVWLWGAATSLSALAVAVVHLSGAGLSEEVRAGRLRLELMLLGGLLGLATALLGFVLPFTVYSDKLAAGLESWRANWQAVLWPGVAVLGGLVLMFVSLQLGRGMERQNQHVRRLIYGYNAVLTGVLLLAVLALPNVLAYAEPFTRFFGRPFDWTQTGVNAVSDKMRNLLASTREPIKVYALLPRNNPITIDTQTLLDNCRSLSPRLTWEQVNPQAAENMGRVRELMEKYSISDPLGLLIVVGTEGEKTRPAFTFVKYRDLFEQDTNPRRGGGGLSYAFVGENALFNGVVSLIEGKMVIYFTTGHGELTLDDNADKMPPNRPRQAGSLSRLKAKLTERKGVEVKALPLDRSTKKVPDDASVVVIARPTEEFGKTEVSVLRDYLARTRVTRKGKDAAGEEKDEESVTAGRLMVLVEPVVQKEGATATLVRTGLEALLAEHGVQLGANRVLTLSNPNPLEVLCWTTSNSSNPIAKAFHPSPETRTVFMLSNVRTVEPLPESGGKAVDRILEAPPNYGVWAEKNVGAEPDVLAEALHEDRERALKTLSRTPLSVGVAVSDSGAAPGAPRDAAHAGLLKDTPKLVVFGSANWIGDEALAGARGALRVDLFNSSVSWLREQSAIGKTIEGKKRKEYDLNVPQQDAGRLTYLPLGLLVLSVIGLGTGVWVVRRR